MGLPNRCDEQKYCFNGKVPKIFRCLIIIILKALSYLNKYFVKYKYRLIFGTVCAIIAQILALVTPVLIGDSLDVVGEYLKGTVTGLDVVKDQLLRDILTILGAVLLAGIFRFFMRQAIIVMSRYIEYDLKNEVYTHYQKLSLNFYKQNKIGDLMNRISEDVSKVRMYFGPAIMYSINMVTLFIVVISYMFHTDVTLTLYTLIPLPVLSVSIYLLSREINHRSKVVQQYLSKLTAVTQEYFSGMQVVKAYAIEEPTFKYFNHTAKQSKEKNIAYYKLQALFFPLMILLIGVSNIMVIYIGGMRYINGVITFGVIAQFIVFVNMLTWPVAAVGWITSIVQTAEASQYRINEFLNTTPEITNPTNDKMTVKGEVSFKNVSLRYQDSNTPAVQDVSFHVKPGETLAILGKTGSGKTTVANLIARLYDADSGQILVDGTPISEFNLDTLRSSMGYVPQEDFLFSDTIANNIKFGNENATRKEIEDAAKNAHIHHSITQFSKGYETFIGERGVTLSGGQKQRISIARALIKDPKILILDDCLSAVDTETEEIILNHLERISKNKTTFIITHRVSSAKNVDKIIVMEEGKIVQQGTHDQLMEQEGFYKTIYNQQLSEQFS